MSLTEKIQPGGQKKILALDGGGIRGILTVEILARIEELLREKMGGKKNSSLPTISTFLPEPVPGRSSPRVFPGA